MDPVTLLLFVLGLGLLLGGAELLVRGAAGLAGRVGIPPLVVGLTVVAFGTSSPELAVSLQSAAAGQADLSLGNVVGSNVFNVLFILGVSAVVAPLLVSRQLVRIDVPVMIGVTLACWALGADGRVGRWEGVAMVVALVGYTVAQIRIGTREGNPDAPTPDGAGSPVDPPPGESPGPRIPLQLLLIVLGLGMLTLGSRWLVDGAVQAATAMGISELVVGLTVIAAGTSLPEVATSILASIRGQRDIAVGNVVGSNIFNLLGVLGLSAVVAPDGVLVPPSALAFDFPVMAAVALACLPIFFTGMVIARWEGLVFLAYYAAYVAYLILQATRHDALEVFGGVMLLFVVPLTALTLILVLVRERKGRR